jgi:hypothetical protein
MPVDGGRYFDFPATHCGGADVCSVHYVTTPVEMSVTTSGHVEAVFQVSTTGAPVFNYWLSPDNTCDYPAHARFYLQRAGDDFSGQGEYQFYRWFSNEAAYRLGAGSAHLIATFTPGQWTSVFGKKGNYDPAAMAGFMEALNHLWTWDWYLAAAAFMGTVLASSVFDTLVGHPHLAKGRLLERDDSIS